MAITLAEWAAELEKAGEEWPHVVHKLVEDVAKQIRDDWRSRWRGLGDAKYLWAAVTYDVYDDGEGSRAEIGPDKSLPQGALGNLLEFGSINNAPRPGGEYALDKADSSIDRKVEDALVKILEGED